MKKDRNLIDEIANKIYKDLLEKKEEYAEEYIRKLLTEMINTGDIKQYESRYNGELYYGVSYIPYYEINKLKHKLMMYENAYGPLDEDDNDEK